MGPAGALPRRRGADAPTASPTSSSSTSPTRTSRSTRPTVFSRHDGLPTRRTPATPPTCSPATSCSTWPATDDDHWERSIAELQRVIDTDPLDAAVLPPATHRPRRDRQPGRLHQGRPRDRRPSCPRCTPGSPPGSTGSTTPACGCARRRCRRSPGTWAASSTATSSSARDDTADLGRALRPPAVPRRLALQAGRQLRGHVRSPTRSTCSAPHAEHLHLVDATGVDGEGVQVGDGEIDWSLLARQLDARRPGRPASSPRSGRATSTTARASGSPSSGWSSGSDASGHAHRPTALWAIPVSDLRRRRPARARRGVRAGIPGWRTEFLVPDPGRWWRRCAPAAPSVRVRRFGPDHGLRSLRVRAAARRGRLPARVVHTHLSYADVVAALGQAATAPRWSPPSTASPTTTSSTTAARPPQVRGLMHRARVRRADSLIAVSDATLRVAAPQVAPAGAAPRPCPPQRHRPAPPRSPRPDRGCTSCPWPGWRPRSGCPSWSPPSPWSPPTTRTPG